METSPDLQKVLDRMTALAGQALSVPAVCVAMVDVDNQLVTSSYGLPVPTALLVSHVFRRQVVSSHGPLVVTDGRRDSKVARHPVVRDGTVSACVGMPLRTSYGRAVGTLLAMDPKPREWTAPQVDFLGRLSSLIMQEVEMVWLMGAGRRMAT